MKATRQLHELGQSLWLDNITPRAADERHAAALHRRALGDRADLEPDDLRSGDRERQRSTTTRSARKTAEGKSGEALFFELALEDLTQAADLFRPVHDATDGVDGWVSLEVSPLLANDTAGTHQGSGATARAGAARPISSSRFRARPRALPAIEESIFAGVPINVTLLFSREQYLAAAEAYLRGIERRIAAGLDPKVDSVASLFVSRWDVAVKDKVAAGAAQSPRHRHRQAHLQGLPRSAGFAALAASSPAPAPGRSACSGRAPAPRIPQRRTRCTSKRSPRRTPSTPFPKRRCSRLPITAQVKGDDAGRRRRCRGGARRVRAAGVDDAALAAQLQREGAEAFDKSWQDLLDCIAPKAQRSQDGRSAERGAPTDASRSASAPLDRAAGVESARGASPDDAQPCTCGELFADDPRRGERLTAEAAGLYLDYSKNRITDETLRLLVRLAEECGLRERIEAMFRGERSM